MAKAVRGTPGVLSDLYCLTPDNAAVNGEGGSESPHRNRVPASLKSTTVDAWLVPRLVAAAAVLHARSCSLSDASQNADSLHLYTDLIDLAIELLDIGISHVGELERARAILIECLCAVYRAFARSGRPAFPPHLAPSLKLIAHLGADAAEQQQSIFAFFTAGSSTELVGAVASAINGAKGTATREEGISRLWLAEDYTSFSPDFGGKSLSRAHKAALSHSLLLTTVDVILKLASKRPDKLADLASAAGKTLLGEWTISSVMSESAPAKELVMSTSLDATRLRIASSALTRRREPLPAPVKRRIAIFIIRHFALAIRGGLPRSAYEGESSYIEVLQEAVQRCGDADVADEASTALNMLTHAIIIELTAKDVPPTSGLQLDAAAKAEQDGEMRLKALALDGLIVLLQNDVDVKSFGMHRPQALIKDLLKLNDEGEEEVDEDLDDVADFVSPRQRSQFLEILANRASNRSKKAAVEEIGWEEVKDGIREDDSPALREGTNLFERPSHGSASNIEGFAATSTYGIRLASKRFCFEARSLARSKSVIFCKLCESSAQQPSRKQDETGKVFGPDRLQEMQARHLVTSCASTLTRMRGPSAIASVDFINSLCKHAYSEPLLQVVGMAAFAAVLRAGLSHKERSVRLAAGRLGAQVVRQASEVEASKRASLSPIFQIYLDNLNGTKRRRIETAILGMGLMGDIDDDKVQDFVLLNLVLQLGSDTFSKSLAYTTITQLAAQHRCTNFQLLAPCLETISVQVVEKMTSAPTLFLEVLALTNQNQSKFLLSTLHYTLPRVLDLEETKSDKTLKLIASAIGQNVRAMCFEQAAAVLRHFLMLPSPRREEGMNRLVAKVRGDEERGDINLKGMLKSYSVELVGPLVTCLGDPNLHDSVSTGLIGTFWTCH